MALGLLRDRIFDSVPVAIAANFYPENETAPLMEKEKTSVSGLVNWLLAA